MVESVAIKEEIGKADLNGYVGEGNRSDEEEIRNVDGGGFCKKNVQHIIVQTEAGSLYTATVLSSAPCVVMPKTCRPCLS